MVDTEESICGIRDKLKRPNKCLSEIQKEKEENEAKAILEEKMAKID